MDSHAEVAQASVHRLDLCFKIGDGPIEVPLARAAPASILAFALAQYVDRDRHPPYATLQAVTLELGTQGAAGGRRGGAHGEQVLIHAEARTYGTAGGSSDGFRRSRVGLALPGTGSATTMIGP